ncbi:helix-turn-helix domain-containing protein [Streptomyces sp. NPDC001455]|uniref:MmyB family transcriptional regulator n=1 Tax=Streptomyces sp. NPDC001455 TaxID=3154518 RepID=UPI00331A501D
MTKPTADPPAITRVLRNARARIDASRTPGIADRFRAKPGLTQREVAKLLGSSPRWYRDLELGKSRNFSMSYLRSVRRALALDEAEWEIVWRAVSDSPPSDAGRRPPAPHKSLPDSVVAFVEDQRWPALLCDHRGDALAWNAAAARGAPWLRRGMNVLEWTLTHPDARHQLINWKNDWAMPMAARLRLHSEQWPGDERIQSLVESVCSDPAGFEIWNSPELQSPTRCGGPELRRVFLPHRGGESSVTLLALKIRDMPSSELVVAVPSGDV